MGDLEERWREDSASGLVARARIWRLAVSISWRGLRDRVAPAATGSDDSRGIMTTGLTDDARFALRLLRRRPAATAAVILTLALGIGATTALFSVVDAWVLRPLPFKDASRLVVLWETIPSASIFSNTPAPTVFGLWRDRARSFEVVAPFTRETRNLTGQGDPERLESLRVSPAVVDLLGLRPATGRLFTAGDGQAPAPAVALLSHGFWQRRFGGSPDVVGRTIRLDDTAFEIVGVLPEHARPLGFTADVWTPLAFSAKEAQSGNRYLWVLGRLRADATVATATAEIDRLAREASDGGTGGRVVSLRDETLGETGSDVLVLFGASAIVLIIACANVASLTLAQVLGRRRELASRLALGASRWRVARQLLIESLVISVFGGAAGVLVAHWATGALVSIAPAAARLGDAVVLDARVLAFAVLATGATAVAFGLLPAWQSTRADLSAGLRAGGRGASAARRRTMGALVIAEIAITLVLLVSTALVTRSFLRLTAVDLGFDAKALVFAQLPRADPGPTGAAFFDELERQLAGTLGVTGVALSQGLPLLAVGSMGSSYVIEGNDATPRVLAYWRIVNPRYFDTLGMRVVQGRAIDASDGPGAAKVAVVSESFARRAWPDLDPVGRRIGWGSFAEPIVVVGVAADVRQSRAAEPSPHVYMPYRQVDTWLPTQIAVRASLPAAATIDLVRRVTHSVDPNQPVASPRSGADELWRAMSRRRFHLTLFAVLAAIATMLAVVGVYGVLSFLVTAERRELGIRAALGATPAQLRGRWLGRGAVLIVTGLSIGVTLAWWTGRLMQGFLFGIAPNDAVALGGGVAVVVVTALAACVIPARRAASVDPIDALRDT